jgi:hypothetical protein
VTDTTEEKSKALWAVCEDCRHTWAAAYYPMSVKELAKIAGRHSRCPKCDGRGLIARQRDGELLEPSP